MNDKLGESYEDAFARRGMSVMVHAFRKGTITPYNPSREEMREQYNALMVCHLDQKRRTRIMGNLLSLLTGDLIVDRDSADIPSRISDQDFRKWISFVKKKTAIFGAEKYANLKVPPTY